MGRDARPAAARARRAPGLGDRWLAGEALPGVRFALHDAVRVAAGEHAGASGTILLLARVAPEVEYVVRLRGGGELRVGQDGLLGEG